MITLDSIYLQTSAEALSSENQLQSKELIIPIVIADRINTGLDHGTSDLDTCRHHCTGY